MCFVRSAELLKADWFKNAKVKLVFMGNGSAEVGKSVALELGIFEKGARLVVDDSAQSDVFRSFGAKRGVLRTFALRRIENFIGLITTPLQLWKGRLPKLPMMETNAIKSASSSGDPFLQGATFVFDENMNMIFRLIEENPGYPKVDPGKLKRAVEKGERYGLITVRSVTRSRFDLLWKYILAFGLVLLVLGSRGKRT